MRIIKITEKNAYYWHRRIWMWLEKNPNKGKSDWPGWRYLEPCPFHCVACAISKIRNGGSIGAERNCLLCPIESWAKKTNNPKYAICEVFQYGKWKTFKHMRCSDGKSKMASIIANLKWR